MEITLEAMFARWRRVLLEKMYAVYFIEQLLIKEKTHISVLASLDVQISSLITFLSAIGRDVAFLAFLKWYYKLWLLTLFLLGMQCESPNCPHLAHGLPIICDGNPKSSRWLHRFCTSISHFMVAQDIKEPVNIVYERQ